MLDLCSPVVSKVLLIFQADGEDELKKRQLMELAIINGTYRDSSTKSATRKFSLTITSNSDLGDWKIIHPLSLSLLT